MYSKYGERAGCVGLVSPLGGSIQRDTLHSLFAIHNQTYFAHILFYFLACEKFKGNCSQNVSPTFFYSQAGPIVILVTLL